MTFSLASLAHAPLVQWFQVAQNLTSQGEVLQRIGSLAQVPRERLAVQILGPGVDLSLGDTQVSFALMSAMKPFLLLYLLETAGAETVAQWVDDRPSPESFDSLGQLLADGGRPRNPMINSGAMTLADRLPEATGADRCQGFVTWLNAQAGSSYHLDQPLLDCVQRGGRQGNIALVQALELAGAVGHAARTLDTYEHLCCLAGTVRDLARLGLLLALPHPQIQPQHQAQVNQIMLTCGLYEASEALAQQVGLPMKSGVSGALVAVVPGQGTIAIYGPAIDGQGNSIAGLSFISHCVNAP